MTTFSDLGYKPEILKALAELGFETPTPIQEKTASLLINSDSDMVGLAQTGTGKTAAFGLPIVHDIDPESTHIQALVLTPTRELCMQVARDLESYSKHIKGTRILAVYGGTDIKTQIKKLRPSPQVVVATPGRLLDLIRRGNIKLGELEILVLDEADEMLNMGFKDDIESILNETPEDRRTLMFSATMPREVANIAKKYLYQPTEVTIGNRNESTSKVSHHVYVAASRDRYNALRRIVDVHPGVYAMIFCRTRAETKDVAERLAGHGYNADALHGDLSQSQRDYVMDKFRKKTLQLLVATDVAARGIDVDNLTHVINYNLPDDAENYTHRSGRTGRAGNEGISIAIIHSRESGRLREIERVINKKFQQQKIPSGWDVCQSQLVHFLEKLAGTEVNENSIGSFLPAAMEHLASLDKEELIKKIVSHEFQHLLNDYRNAPDLNIDASKKERGRREGGRDSGRNERRRDDSGGRKKDRDKGVRGPSRGGNWEQVGIDMGTKDQLNPALLIGIVNKTLGNKDSKIGRINIGDDESTFEVELMTSVALLEQKKAKYRGKNVTFYKE